jgi:hypothetical protein
MLTSPHPSIEDLIVDGLQCGRYPGVDEGITELGRHPTFRALRNLVEPAIDRGKSGHGLTP